MRVTGCGKWNSCGVPAGAVDGGGNEMRRKMRITNRSIPNYWVDADRLMRLFMVEDEEPYQDVPYLDCLDYAAAGKSAFEGLARRWLECWSLRATL